MAFGNRTRRAKHRRKEIFHAKKAESILNWLDTDEPHGSVVMLPDGRIFGRAIGAHAWQPFAGITVVGDDLLYWRVHSGSGAKRASFERQEQLFGEGTMARLSGLRIGVVGCSGTESVIVELYYSPGLS